MKIILGLVAAACALAFLAFHFHFPAIITRSQHAAARAAFQDQPVASSTSAGLRIPILIYHTVSPEHPGETLMQRKFNVPPDIFEAQLRYLQSHGYTTISMDELVNDLKTGTTSPIAKPVVLGFDDGWQDQYTTVLPLLQKYHDTAIFYVYTNPIGKDPRFLTWDKIKALQAAGMTIGSHTLSHPYLSKLTPEQLRREVFDSKAILERELGTPVVHFASPFGYTSDALVALLQEAGYTTGRTTYKGNVHSEDSLLRLSGYFAPQTLHDLEWIVGYAP
jgi:peptidoglycan/xylan/chitin deacetylase (PgdA/CDA1 family)